MSPFTIFAHAGHDGHTAGAANVASDAVIAGIMLFLIAFAFITYILVSFMLSRIFKKAGVAGWKAWVPVYSTWTTLELGEQKGWWALLYLAPFLTVIPMDVNSPAFLTLYLITLAVSLVGTVFLCMAMYKIGLRLGKEGYFVLWAIFLPVVWYAWLAFDNSTWKKTSPAVGVSLADPSKE